MATVSGETCPMICSDTETRRMLGILVVHNDPSFFDAVAWLLRSDCRVLVVRNTLEAVRLLNQTSAVDLLVVDVCNPPDRPDAITLACMTRAWRPSLPILFLATEHDWRRQGDTLSNSTVLLKPTTPDEVVMEVREIMAALTEAHTI
jgi:DNA-binding LytR/AlgR family response regulator